MTPSDVIGLGFAVCEVATANADGLCSCRLRFDCNAPGKHPVGRDWLRLAVARRSRPTFRVPTGVRLAPATSYGLIPMPGSGLIVIDRDDPDVLLPLPETFEVHRASAHERRGHYYYRLPAEIAEDDVPRAFAGGEVRVAASGHVVGSGCRHASGDLYEDNGADVAFATPELIDALRALPPVRRGADGSIEAVMGSRHDWLVRQARKFAGWGWDVERIAEQLRDLNDEHCQPPLTEREAEFERMAAWAGKSIRPDAPIAVRRVRSWQVVRHG